MKCEFAGELGNKYAECLLGHANRDRDIALVLESDDGVWSYREITTIHVLEAPAVARFLQTDAEA